MDTFFIEVVNLSITASWLVLAVILLRPMLKKAPKAITVALWAIVGIRLALPFSIKSIFSLVPSASTIPKEIVYAKEPTIDSGVSSINAIVNPIITETFAPPSELTSINPIQIFFAIAENIWILGIIAMVIYAAVSYLRLYKRVRESLKHIDNIYICDNIPSPFILGIFRPRIFLPSDMNKADTDFVIAHEKAHLKRKDHFWKPLGFALLTFYWFNPILWVGYILLCRDIELACDERVIREMSKEDKAAYSSALLNCGMPRHMISACPLAFGEVCVKKRIKSVLNYKKPAFWIIIVALVITSAVAVAFLTDPKDGTVDLTDITAHAYGVDEVIYQAAHLSYIEFAGTNTPCYTITQDLLLLEKPHEGYWKSVGTLKEIELSKYNFSVFFLGIDFGWHDGYSAEKLIKHNAKAYKLDGSDLYYVLQQTNGEVYIVSGNNKHISRIYKVEPNVFEDTGIIAVSGKNSVPVTVLDEKHSLEEIKNKVNWLTMDFNKDMYVPFNIYCDGNVQLGFFSIYDANTFERLDYFTPSGLFPHTYIFQSAKDGGEYIITLSQSAFAGEGDGTLLCFGAKIPGVSIVGKWETEASILGIDDGTTKGTATCVFSEDKSGSFSITGVNEVRFTYANFNGILSLIYTEPYDLGVDQFEYKCNGSTLVLKEVDSEREIVFTKSTETTLEMPPLDTYPNGRTHWQFFKWTDIPENPKEISSVSFKFERYENHSVSSGENTDYLDCLVLSDTENDGTFVLSFQLFQDVYEYIGPLFKTLNSTVTVDYEGSTFDVLDVANERVQILVNGEKATITEVRLGAGNGHRDFYFTFDTKDDIKLKDIKKFEFVVTSTSTQRTPILESGIFKVYPATSSDYIGGYNEFILECGDRYKSFTGECLWEDHWRREMYVDDLTGDGVNDITVVFQNSHGTGVATEDIHVFDGVTLEEYKVEQLHETIGKHATFYADENNCYIKIGNTEYCIDKASLEPHYDKEYWWNEPTTTYIFNFSVENGILKVELPCQFTPSGFVGSIFADYQFSNGEFVYATAIYK